MSLNFTEIAIGLIGVFAALGWIRGARRAAVTMGGIFFAMVLIGLIGSDLVRVLGQSGFKFHPPELANLFLAILFAFIVYVVRLAATRVIGDGPPGRLTRRQRVSGLCMGLLNGFLLVANIVREADPYLQSVVNARTGGWTWHVPLLHISQAQGSSVTVSIQMSPLTITPSPLLNIYSTLPTALVLLFGFLIFVFVGTVYGRVVHARR
jgi:Colicin V production protein